MQITLEMQKVLSIARLSKYSTNFAVHLMGDPLKLYVWNMRLAESLYPLLQTVEVGLRNSLNAAVSAHYNDPIWLLGSEILEPHHKEIVQKQKAKILHKGRRLIIDNVVSELNFGFWTSLLDAAYEEKFWRTKILRNTFPYMPREIRKRKNISKIFSKIRHLRNRIFHYEPIWHWQDLLQQHDMIIQAISWIEPQQMQLFDRNRFKLIYVGRKNKKDTTLIHTNEFETV